MRTILIIAFLAVPSVGALCDTSEDAGCLDKVCTGGPVCLGNIVRDCADSGTHFIYQPCGATHTCQAGACVERTCTDIGTGTCTDDHTASVCNEAGTARVTVTCTADQVCALGECVPATCTDGESRCTPFQVLDCDNGQWVPGDACGEGDVCVTLTTGHGCRPQSCEPQTARCEQGASKICDAYGAAEAITNCTGGTLCVGGFCQEEVCNVPPGTVEILPAPGTVTTRTSQITFDLGGATHTLNTNARADYEQSDKSLVISGSKGTRKLWMRLAPVDPLTTGTWSDAVSSAVGVTVCYVNGVSSATLTDCPDGYSHRSVAYDVTISANPGTGRFVEGTFTTTVKDNSGATTPISSGVIDVKLR